MKTNQSVLAVTALGGLLAVVHPAFAQTWTQTSAPAKGWLSIASSADGTRLSAACYPSVYISTNSGTNWIQTSTPSNSWSAVASSADGRKLVAAAFDGPIYISTNAGATWKQASAPNQWWNSVASSADGTRLAAVAG